MRVLITGGTGLIGAALAADLAQNEYEVVVLSRNPGQQTLPTAVRAEKWDGRTAAGWGHLADGATAIINLAGAGMADGRWTPARKKGIINSRLDAGKAVVEAVNQAQHKPKVVIQASAIGYYGSHGDEKLTEEASPGSNFTAQVCQLWEPSTAPVEEMGVRRAVVRTGLVLSTAGGALPKMALPFRLFAGGPLGSGKQYLSWIHIDDEVRALRFLLENETARGAFNLSAPNPLPNKAFGQILGRVLSRPALLPTPAFALRLLFGKMADVLLEGQRVVPQKLQKLGFTFKYTDLQAALTDLFK